MRSEVSTRPTEKYSDCEFDAFGLIDAWRRNPRQPQTEMERICQAVVENDREHLAYRRAIAATRAEQVAQVLPPEPDPTVIKIIVKDESTGRRLRLTVPASWVETAWE